MAKIVVRKLEYRRKLTPLMQFVVNAAHMVSNEVLGSIALLIHLLPMSYLSFRLSSRRKVVREVPGLQQTPYKREKDEAQYVTYHVINIGSLS